MRTLEAPIRKIRFLPSCCWKHSRQPDFSILPHSPAETGRPWGKLLGERPHQDGGERKNEREKRREGKSIVISPGKDRSLGVDRRFGGESSSPTMVSPALYFRENDEINEGLRHRDHRGRA